MGAPPPVSSGQKRCKIAALTVSRLVGYIKAHFLPSFKFLVPLTVLRIKIDQDSERQSPARTTGGSVLHQEGAGRATTRKPFSQATMDHRHMDHIDLAGHYG